MQGNRTGHDATRVVSGKVLISAGSDGSTGVATAELYDPATETFTSTGSMATAHLNAPATLIGNGDVLVAGGLDSSGNLLATAERFDPNAGTFTLTAGGLVTANSNHTATLLTSGEVLLAGGIDINGFTGAAELFDSASGMFTGTGSLIVARSQHTATRLLNGDVLVTGGFTADGATASAELYQ